MGMINGKDMTVEAAIAKLAYLLGKNLEINEIKRLIGVNLRGELSTPHSDEKLSLLNETHFIQTIIEGITKESEENRNDNLKDLIIPSLIFFCAKHGFVDILEKLKFLKVDFNCGDYDERKPIHIACKENRIEVVKFLINENINLDSVDRFGNSPLWEAVKNKNEDICRLVREKGGKIAANAEEIIDMIFNFATENKHEDLRFFHANGLENLEEYLNYDKRTIAHVAAFKNNRETLNLLNELGFDFGKKDRWGRTVYDEIKERIPELFNELKKIKN
jgi:lysophospholipase